MKGLRKKFAIGLTGLVGLLSGCSSASAGDEPSSEETNTLTLAFTLIIDTPSSGLTRSGDTWGSEYDSEQSDYDQAVDPTNMQVTLWDPDGNYVVSIDQLSGYATGDNTYQYYGEINKENLRSGTNYRCMVVINCDEIDFEQTPNLSTFSLSDYPQVTDEGTYRLPMWGVATFPLVFGTSKQDAGTITLLRAMAKCRLHLSEALIAKGYTLSNGVLKGMNTQGYLFPGHFAEVESTGSLSFTAGNKYYGFNPHDSWSATARQTLLREPGYEVSGSTTEATSLICYLPEQQQTEQQADSLSFDITFGTSGHASFTIGLEDTSGTTPELISDLQRNHVYDFEIVSIKYGLEVNTAVSDWDDMSEVWDFSEQISGDLTLHWTEGSYSSIDEVSDNEEISQSLTVLNDVAAIGRFSINSPSGATWYATLTSESGNYFAFETEQDGVTKLSTTVSGETGTGLYSVLRVRATVSNNTQQHIAKLTILVRYKDGTSRKVESLSCWEIIQPI
jgi:hypothetical protein